MIINNVPVSGGGGTTDPLALPTDYTTTAPATPSTGVTLFSRLSAGRRMPAFVTPTGRTERIGPWLGNNTRYEYYPVINSTSLNALGFTAIAPVGTSTLQNLSNTNFMTSQRRLQLHSAATAGAMIEMKPAMPLVMRRSPGVGFHVVMRFGISALVTNSRWFFGISSGAAATAPAAWSNVDPSTQLNIAGILKDGADTNFQVASNDSTGAATKHTNLTTIGAPALNYTYQIELFATVTNTSSIGWRVTRWTDTGAEAMEQGTFTTDLPDIAGFYSPRIWGSNNATAAANGIHFMYWYIEQD